MTPSPLPVDALATVADDLDRVMTLPLGERAAAFEAMHRVLAAALETTADRTVTDPGRVAR